MANDHMEALPSGHRIREYEIRRVLDRGGFGITYLAHDTLLDRDVAVKNTCRRRQGDIQIPARRIVRIGSRNRHASVQITSDVPHASQSRKYVLPSLRTRTPLPRRPSAPHREHTWGIEVVLPHAPHRQ